MRTCMMVLAGLLLAFPGMPEEASGQQCLICLQEGECHAFSSIRG